MDLHQTPVVGVNLGRLGFFSGFRQRRSRSFMASDLRGTFPLLEHVMLECSVWQNGNFTHHQLGLNEARFWEARRSLCCRSIFT